MVSKTSSSEIICNGTATAVTSTPCSYISSVSLDRAAVVPSLLRVSLPILLLFTSERTYCSVAEERKMARREDDSYTNGSVFEVSVEEGRKDKSEAYAIDEPQPAAEAEADDDALCGMSASVSFIQQVTDNHLALVS